MYIHALVLYYQARFDLTMFSSNSSSLFPNWIQIHNITKGFKLNSFKFMMKDLLYN